MKLLPRAGRRIRSRRYQLARGLSMYEARRQAARQDRRAGYGDYRGFVYSPRTGVAYLT